MQSLLHKELADQRFDNISAAVQEHFENLMVEWVRNAVEATGVHKVACSGGLFLNVKANKRLRELPVIDDIFFYPACDDGGMPVGAALEGYVNLCRRDGLKIDVPPLADLYYGMEHSNEEIDRLLNEAKMRAKPQYVDDVDAEIGEMISKGKIVGRFSGRDEWGPRALGNRSILADPRNLTVIRRLNHAIKMRDFWMPFAPSTIEEDSSKYFKECRAARYMIEAFDTTREANDIIAGLHPFDGTARPQTVNEWNLGYRKLLLEFRSRTGVSGVLNTSFNLHGFPIVGTPELALFTLKNSALDAVAIGNWLVERCCV
jgi:carbamoyltransferase